MKKKVITICASSNFYKHVNQVADELEAKGFEVIVPHNAAIMRKTGDYDVVKLRTWLKDPSEFTKKQKFMDMHFKEVEKADAILVVNDEKNGVKGYIGANGLMEMALGYYLKKPIFILNPVSKDSSVYEEVHGMGAVILHSDLDKIDL